jgi:hypothetical protein
MIIFQVPLINKDDYFDTFNYTSYACVFFQTYFPLTVYTLLFALGCLLFFLVIRVLRSLLYSHVHQFRFCCPNS